MAKTGKEIIPNRNIQYVVTPVANVRQTNIRSDEQVIQAQAQIDEDMLQALEEMVNAARAGRMEGQSALSMAAAAW